MIDRLDRLDHLVLTTAHDAVQQHAASSIAHTEASTGSELPQFVKDEFDAFLECGRSAPAASSAWAKKVAACCCTRRYSAVSSGRCRS
jgi:hypothetical protein